MGVTFDFHEYRVLVTGGTSGIGHAIARAFHGAGANVTVTGTRANPNAYDVDLAPFSYRQLVGVPAEEKPFGTPTLG